MRAFLTTLVLLPLSLLPGWAYLRARGLTWVVGLYAIGLAIVITFSLTRLIVDPSLFKAMNLTLLTLVLGTSIHGLSLSNDRHSKTTRTLLSESMLLLCLFIALVVILHTQKSRLFGFDLYHVPSQSMAPTLLPGDIILVDTWQTPSALEPNQIVVFKRAQRSIVLVKRLNELRSTEAGLEMFMLGDNRSYSTDSRRFGWVSTEHVIGVNTGVIANIR